jgi:CRP-like cAMP-binding protein
MNALHALKPAEAHAIEALIATTYTVSAHEDIVREHQPAKEALVLLEGMACHYKVVNSSRRQMTGIVVPGDFCDFAFLSASATRQSVMSLGPALIGRVDLGDLAAVADEIPHVMVAAMRGAAIDRACASEGMINLGARDALQRMAHFLCEIHHRLQVVGLVSPEGYFELPMIQAELGEALGLSTIHVNRTIQQLRKSKLIALAKGQASILDLPNLAIVAGFDSGYLRPH